VGDVAGYVWIEGLNPFRGLNVKHYAFTFFFNPSSHWVSMCPVIFLVLQESAVLAGDLSQCHHTD